MIGGIGSTIKNNVMYKLAGSTNALEFKVFIQDLIKAKSDPNSKPALVFDGASAHKNSEVRTLIEENFISLLLPAYSPRFNSIER